MSLLIETVKLMNGKFYNIEYHNKRLNKSRSDLFHANNYIDLKKIFKNQPFPKKGLFKTRIIYDKEIQKIEFSKYKLPQIKKLRLIIKNNATYSYKFANRKFFEEIKRQLSEGEEAIIVKNGFITDTTFSNLAFYDGEKWYTPNTYLLKGTKREYYINKEILTEKPITLSDISEFSKVSLINTMLDLGQIEIPISHIYF